ncbi:GspH/FimT family pseudopilin [Polynucleobacter sp. MWH-Svant-W18]|uniref:GspH/FimT family pseudopilin n=1 Tax=Polynucleobacter sp. MWH-Svant-W18 TaxID=1855909 RepID=UPI00203F5BF0|nr:GspH/FimT family pseudopilin [Polynucleobacter sp. MWH-Svant-W18]
MNKHRSEGSSLLELMVVILIIAIVAMSTMPLLQKQIAEREINSVARRFIAHAHFARQQAMTLGESVLLIPSSKLGWDGGWVVQSGCTAKVVTSTCIPKFWFSQGAIDPIYFKGGGRQFVDPHSGKSGILFNATGAAKTGQGGFVANRLILGHHRAPSLERHLILSSGGRWRICDPARDAKRCH